MSHKIVIECTPVDEARVNPARKESQRAPRNQARPAQIAADIAKNERAVQRRKKSRKTPRIAQ
jgi:hypothetical protein